MHYNTQFFYMIVEGFNYSLGSRLISMYIKTFALKCSKMENFITASGTIQ